MPLQITATYAAVLALLLIVLSYHVILARAKAGVSILDGGDMALATRIRRHGNFAEFVPMALIVMALAEGLGGNATALHVAGVLLVAGRVLHPLGLDAARAVHPLRIIGITAGQASVLICVALIVLKTFF